MSLLNRCSCVSKNHRKLTREQVRRHGEKVQEQTCQGATEKWDFRPIYSRDGTNTSTRLWSVDYLGMYVFCCRTRSVFPEPRV
jgi:hypothetical protein